MSLSKRGKVVVAMSGGVDSSVAASLLQREGWDVVGVFMRLGSPTGVASSDEADSGDAGTSHDQDPSGTTGQGAVATSSTCDPAGKSKQGCCSVLDAADARRVAGLLDIPFYVLNFQEDFGRVIDYFVSEYNRGRTPNPCVRCNDWLKFGKLARYAQAVGATHVASGHYARIGVDPILGEKVLMRGLDHRKDQSYVLFGMKRETVEHTLLPVGDFEKPRVRAMAEEWKLPVFNKPDSQEICFVPNQDYAGLVKRRTPEAFHPGELVTADGQQIGAHEGHQHFTIGQRKGVGVALGYPIYVVDIDPLSNRVTMGPKEALFKSRLIARQTNWISNRIHQAGGTMKCQAKIRYNHQPQEAMVSITGDDELAVRFEVPQTAITPGQAVVCFDGEIVLGGGWIETAGE